jgi:hypothetical protein
MGGPKQPPVISMVFRRGAPLQREELINVLRDPTGLHGGNAVAPLQLCLPALCELVEQMVPTTDTL